MNAVSMPQSGESFTFSEAYRNDPLAALLAVGTGQDYVWLQIGRRRALLVNTPTLLQAIMTDRSFIRGKVSRNLRRLFGDGLGTLDGDAHREHREVLLPAFSAPVVDALYAPTIAAETPQFVEQLGANVPLDVFDSVSSFLVSLTARNLFGMEWDAYADSIAHCLRTGSRFIVGQTTHPGETFCTRQGGYFQPAFEKALDEVFASNPHAQEVRRAIAIIFREGVERRGWSLEMARDEMRFLLVAGVETTAATIAFALDLLARYPQVQEDLYTALTTIDQPAQDLVRDVGLLAWIVKETLRLFPPVWVFTREASQDGRSAGIDIPQGTLVLLSAYVTHRDERYFRTPATFLPERFSDRVASWTYFPFGGGHRHCVGADYGMITVYMLVATVVRHFRVTTMSTEPMELEPAASLTPRPSHRLILERR